MLTFPRGALLMRLHISESYAGAGADIRLSHTASVSGDTGDMSSDIDEECDSIYSTPKCKPAPPGEDMKLRCRKRF